MRKHCIIAIAIFVALALDAKAESVTVNVTQKQSGGAPQQQQFASLLSACLPGSEPLHIGFKRRSLAKLRAPLIRVLLQQRRDKCRRQRAMKEHGEREQAKRRNQQPQVKRQAALALRPN